MERIIVRRLSHILEPRGILTNIQSGFRKGRSTTDALVRVSNDVDKALRMKELMTIVYFDIEKAYDTMWREGLLIKLSSMGIGGRLYNWIMDFLTGRKIQVKVGSEVSIKFDVDNGIPQGSVISPILFNIMINGCIRSALYADDGRNVSYVLGNIRKAIREVEMWSYKWGFKMSTRKSCYMMFTKKRKCHDERLTLYEQPMVNVNEFKYLELLFDSRSPWKTHIKHLETKYKKVINLLRAVAGCDWGADRQSLN